MRLYMRVIIETWDNMRDEVLRMDRLGIEESVLSFSETFRMIAFGDDEELDRIRNAARRPR